MLGDASLNRDVTPVLVGDCAQLDELWAAPRTVDIRAALRLATAPAHGRLHRHDGLAALLRGSLSRVDYTKLLLRLLGLHAPIEDRLAAHTNSVWLAWFVADRASRLRLDLTNLGIALSEVAAAPMAHTLLPPLDDDAAALGCAWVVEGSALGGRVLARNIGAVTSGVPGLGGAFFRAPADQAERWRACGVALEVCGADPTRHRSILVGATATFAAFEAWLAPRA